MSQGDFRRIRFGRSGETIVVAEHHARSVDDPIGDDAGIHEHCHGRVEYRQISEHGYALICRGCFIRLPLPPGFKSYRELYDYMNSPEVLFYLGVVNSIANQAKA